MVSKAKADLRSKTLNIRDNLPEAEHAQKSETILHKLLEHPRFKEAKTVAFYLHKGSEVDTRRMISKSLTLGKEVLVPVTDHKITFFKFISFNELKRGKYGILEPKERIEPARPPEVVIIPGACFGLCMHRIGYGKGYYDDFLGKSFAFRIGLCFDFQVQEKLPRHSNDQRMDAIITEKRIIT